MKKLLAIYLCILVIASMLSAFFYRSLYRVLPESQNQVERTMLFLNTDSTNYDFVFIGTSRVFAHINPAIIDSVCGVNSRCLALAGSTITQQYAILKKYLQRHAAPKLILLGLDYPTLNSSIPPYRYPDYYAYLNDSVFGAINMKGVSRFKYHQIFEGYDKFVLYSAKTDYQKLEALPVFLKLPHKPVDLHDDDALGEKRIWKKGFSPIEEKWGPEASSELAGKEQLLYEKQGVQFLEEFIATAKQASPHVIIAFTPAYIALKKRYTNQNAYFEEIKSITAKMQIPFWDYSTDSLCNDTAYFHNAAHMNKRGEEIFSNTLATDINKYLQH